LCTQLSISAPSKEAEPMEENKPGKLILSQESLRHLSQDEPQSGKNEKHPNVSFTCPIISICKKCP
jgi:hypothetical protein